MNDTVVTLICSYPKGDLEGISVSLEERFLTLGITVVATISFVANTAKIVLSAEEDSQTLIAWSVPLLEKKYDMKVEEIKVQLPPPEEE